MEKPKIQTKVIEDLYRLQNDGNKLLELALPVYTYLRSELYGGFRLLNSSKFMYDFDAVIKENQDKIKEIGCRISGKETNISLWHFGTMCNFPIRCLLSEEELDNYIKEEKEKLHNRIQKTLVSSIKTTNDCLEYLKKEKED